MSSDDDLPQDDTPQPAKSAGASRKPRKSKVTEGGDTASEGSAASTAAGTATDGRRAASRGKSQKGIIAVGVVLNGIYEVRRLIARGGMGEVYEGANVNSDERVAIKVILPHMAADPKVQALFRNEARTLTSFAHPALVQYRVLAREPRRDILYIVTDFIDGEPLLNFVGKVQPTAAELAMLTRRLADGLGAAHGHGAIHRDISPENVLLPGNDLSRAKIIDFGIAKSLEVGAQTVVGDGFAGKLGYVAPEQFGDFGRNIGPWTDIYSLALVILALAGGRAPDMGTTLVEAIDKRRAGPDTSVLPPILQPTFAWMLSPNPKDRPQSMAEVIAALDQLDLSRAPTPSLSTPPGVMPNVGPGAATVIGDPSQVSSWSQLSPQASQHPAASAPTPAPSAPPQMGEAAGAEPTVFLGAAFNREEPAAPASEDKTPTTKVPPPPSSVAAITPVVPSAAVEPEPKTAVPPPPKAKAEPKPRSKPEPERQPEPAVAGAGAPAKGGGGKLLIFGGLAAVVVAGVIGFMLMPKGQKADETAASGSAPIVAPRLDTPLAGALAALPCSWLNVTGGEGGRINVSGVSADPTAVNTTAAAQGGKDVDTSGVIKAPAALCPVLDAAAPLHRPSSAVLAVAARQASFEIDRDLTGCPVGLGALPMATVQTDPTKPFTLLSVDGAGRVRQLVTGRDAFVALAKRYPANFTDLGGGAYRVSMCQPTPSLVGLMAIEGAEPFNLGLRSGAPARPPGDFGARLKAGVEKQGWSAQIAWFDVVNALPDRAPQPTTEVAAAVAPVEAAPAVIPEAEVAAAPVAPAPVTRAAADWQACRRFRGGAWEEMGFGNQAECLQRIFVGQCDVLSGRFGETDLRRYNGQIQAGSGGRFSRKWTSIAASDCPK